MAELLACKIQGNPTGVIRGGEHPQHRLRWGIEVDDILSDIEVLDLAQQTDDPAHDRVPSSGDDYIYGGIRDRITQALDFNVAPTSGSNLKWTIDVTYRPPNAGQKENQFELEFWIKLRTNPLPDFTSVAQLQAHDQNFPWERWVEYNEVVEQYDKGYRIIVGLPEPEETLIRNVNDHYFPNNGSFWPKPSVTQTIVTERLVGSPISAMWLNKYFIRSTNSTPWEMRHLVGTPSESFVQYDERESHFLRATTGRVEWYYSRPFMRCRSYVQVHPQAEGEIVQEQWGTSYISASPDFPGERRADDAKGTPIPRVRLKEDGDKTTDPQEQAQEATWSKYRYNGDYQALVGPAEMRYPVIPPQP